MHFNVEDYRIQRVLDYRKVETLREAKMIWVKRDTQINPLLKEPIDCSRKSDQLFRAVFPVQIDVQEAMVIIGLNRANFYIGHFILSIGGTSGTFCDAKIAFGHLLLMGASGFVMAHNHPSGQLRPSGNDTTLTRKYSQFGEMIECPLLDHLILTEESYYSFADNQLL